MIQFTQNETQLAPRSLKKNSAVQIICLNGYGNNPNDNRIVSTKLQDFFVNLGFCLQEISGLIVKNCTFRFGRPFPGFIDFPKRIQRCTASIIVGYLCYITSLCLLSFSSLVITILTDFYRRRRASN
jgi:hypothetical protein